MLRSCSQCGNLEDNTATQCSKCNGALVSLEEVNPRSKTVLPRAQHRKSHIGPVPMFVAVICLCFVIFLANFHVVRGSTYHGPLFVSRLSVGFSEMFINTDELLNMPIIGAKSRYPLGVTALQRIGFLESDLQREERVKQETDALFERISNPSGRSAEDQLYKLKHGHYPEQ
ncbi:hypothetical protein D3C78_992140 [compost metagenome]